MAYTEDTIAFRSGDVALAGTLTIPAGAGPAPAVVMITGSGPQSRDGEMFGFPMFRLLARTLAGNGIASLRWDDRGTGGSSGNYAETTMDASVLDALEAYAFLRSRPGIDSAATGFLGHSEGAVIAARAAAATVEQTLPGVAFLVMLAGPGISCRENILLQTAAICAADGSTDAATERELGLLKSIFSVLHSGGPTDVLLSEFRSYAAGVIGEMPENQRRAMGDGSEYARVLYRQRMRMMDTPWFRSVLHCDPAGTLQKLTCPALALFAERDVQVVPWVNAEGMRASFRESCHPDATVRILEGANHLFLRAKSGSPAEYPSLEHRFVPGFSEEIVAWILARSHR